MHLVSRVARPREPSGERPVRSIHTVQCFWRAGFPARRHVAGVNGTATIVSMGLVASGYLLGNGLLRAKEADRAVTVRGLAERNVTADLAT